MNGLFRLKNTIKHYEWGSPSCIPRLLGRDGEGRPWAELWMGVHPGGPSETEFRGETRSLADLIAGNPEGFLGKAAAEKFGGLPFLFKFLAAAKPLSIQAHPNREQARRGFDRENREGIALDAPHRNYKDPNHKPEILYALSPFRAMCGFREPEETRRNLERLLSGAPSSLRRGLAPLTAALAGTNAGGGAESGALRAFFSALFALPPELRRELSGHITSRRETGAADAGADACMTAFAERYPGDPAVIAPLYLNLLELQPGEAVYLEAGVLHAYLEGFGMELMANSDNVLRGGLTPKYVDPPELMRILDFSPRRPAILKPPEPEPDWYACAAPCEEFSLSALRSRGGSGLFPETGPAILALTGGKARLFRGGQELDLSPGESVFIPPGEPGEALRYSGSFRACVAALPTAGGGGPAAAGGA
ncbi:MAG: mannose-6-phosphate isomerase, class I [Treponema sp.]|jgi:mannose-6-phosphate isomerase|nr:mannose-6-phosphate isomerase, class I [Treponema sp.]